MRRLAVSLLTRAHPWAAVAGFAFLLHFAWAMRQAPMYRTMVQASHVEAVRVCTLATFGDALIELAAYAAGALVAGNSLWLASLRRAAFGAYIGVGLLITRVA
jgi:hypothetical protein